jgi:hypothetical protein
MKQFVIAAVLAAAGATAASADAYGYAGSNGLSETLRVEVQHLVPGADTSNLSPAQIGALQLLFDNSDNLRSGENPAGKVQVILSRS